MPASAVPRVREAQRPRSEGYGGSGSTAHSTAARFAALLFAGLGFFASAALGRVRVARQPTDDRPTRRVISGTSRELVIAGSLYDFRPTASDPNGDPLIFSINKLPRWATFRHVDRPAVRHACVVDVGRIRDIVISVSDGTYREVAAEVQPQGASAAARRRSRAPRRPAPRRARPIRSSRSASDADGQALRFAIINKPTWASFDTATGRLAGTPGAGSAGAYASVGISVTDGAYTSSLPRFTINVTTTTELRADHRRHARRVRTGRPVLRLPAGGGRRRRRRAAVSPSSTGRPGRASAPRPGGSRASRRPATKARTRTSSSR